MAQKIAEVRTPNGGPRSVADRLALAAGARTTAILGITLALFTVIHTARLGRLLINGDGANYLSGAMRIASGDLPHPRYSPGLAMFLAPLAGLLRGRPSTLVLVAAFMNLVISVAAIVLLQRFLRRYLSPVMSVTVVAVFALGQTATNVLTGTEVEPIALLLLVITLVALQEDRSRLAVVATAVAGMTRIALVPWFGVLWLLRWRRSPRHAATAIGALVIDVATYAVLSRQGSYVAIATQSYTAGDSAGSPVAAFLEVVPDHLVRYSRLGFPSLFWPSAILSTPPGYVLGAVTTLCMVIGALVLLRRDGRSADGVLRPAVVASAAYAVLLWFWPANDGTVLRLSTPLAPVVLLLAVVGARRLAERLFAARAKQVVAVALAGALTVGLAASVGLAVTRRTSDEPVADFVLATRRGIALAPPGPVLSHAPGITQVVSGRAVVSFPDGVSGSEALALAEQSRACVIVVTAIARNPPPEFERFLARSDRVNRLSSVGTTTLYALDEPWCP